MLLLMTCWPIRGHILKAMKLKLTVALANLRSKKAARIQTVTRERTPASIDTNTLPSSYVRGELSHGSGSSLLGLLEGIFHL